MVLRGTRAALLTAAFLPHFSTFMNIFARLTGSPCHRGSQDRADTDLSGWGIWPRYLTGTDEVYAHGSYLAESIQRCTVQLHFMRMRSSAVQKY